MKYLTFVTKVEIDGTPHYLVSYWHTGEIYHCMGDYSDFDTAVKDAKNQMQVDFHSRQRQIPQAAIVRVYPNQQTPKYVVAVYSHTLDNGVEICNGEVVEDLNTAEAKVRQLCYKYVVIGEHTLGYVDPVGRIGVFRSKYHNEQDGPIPFPRWTQVRAATAADFKKFKVIIPPDFN